mgnify:CR=1 FL=1
METVINQANPENPEVVIEPTQNRKVLTAMIVNIRQPSLFENVNKRNVLVSVGLLAACAGIAYVVSLAIPSVIGMVVKDTVSATSEATAEVAAETQTEDTATA